MKKTIFIITLFIFMAVSVTTAYAGILNSYEQDVIAAAKGEFEYKGATYRVDSSYITELNEYLISDDVDLTKDQRDTVLQSINDYIETGVEEGYLVPASSNKENANTEQSDNNASVNSETQEDVDNNQVVASGVNSDSSGQSDQQDLDQETSEITNPDTDDFMGGLLAEASNSGLTSEVETAISNDNDSNSNSDNSSASIIKNTGFNLNRTALIAAGMGIVMLAGMIVTKRFNYFARSDE